MSEKIVKTQKRLVNKAMKEQTVAILGSYTKQLLLLPLRKRIKFAFKLVFKK
jgi:hypothetical protein